MSDKKSDIVDKLQELKNAYIRSLPGKITQIEQTWLQLKKSWEQEILEELHRYVHSLAGSGGTFGFEELTTISRAADNILKSARLSGQQINEPELTQIDNYLKKLSSQIKDISQEDISTVQNPDDTGKLPSFAIKNTQPNTLLILDSDRNYATQLKDELSKFGFKSEITTTPEEFYESVAKSSPMGAIVNVLKNGDQYEGIKITRTIQRQRALHMPVIFISPEGEIESRLKAVRAGGEAYLTMPIDTHQLVETLDSVISTKDSESYRIMIVDDDEFLAQRYAAILTDYGMDVKILTSPLKIMEELPEFRPEMILMDVYMPGCTGLELAKVIRQNIGYINLPIVFLSNETDIEQQYAALRMGGDDFLVKPIKDSHLLSSVITRVQRSRKLASAITKDSLTGLINHAKVREQLELDILRSKRQNINLSFAMVDIDHFKKINDNYGHVVGDYVIREMSRILLQGLRRTDVVGRYGGEEFAIIMPDTSEESAAKVINKLREEFSAIEHVHGKHKFKVTFSCGIAGFPCYQRTSEVVEKADDALYQAKEQGRNRVVISTPSSRRAHKA